MPYYRLSAGGRGGWALEGEQASSRHKTLGVFLYDNGKPTEE